MSSSRILVPGFRWRRSRWGRSCPVALKEGCFVPGKPEFSVGFRDKMYILSSQEAYDKFVTNPRRYLLPPMPSPPCRVCIVGTTASGRSELARLMGARHGVSVLELEKLAEPLVAELEKEWLGKVKEDCTQAAMEKIRTKQQTGQPSSDGTPAVEVTEDHPEVVALVQTALEEAKKHDAAKEVYAQALTKVVRENESTDVGSDVGNGWVLDNFPRNASQLEALQRAGILPDFLFCLMHTEVSQNPSGAPQSEKAEDEPRHKAEKEQFKREWEGLQLSLSLSHSVLQTADRSPKELLDEIVQLMEKPFKYLPREFSAVDLDEEAEDIEAIANLENADDENDSDKNTEDEEGEEEEQDEEGEDSESPGDATAKKSFGDTFNFCPVVLKKQNALVPCTDEISAKYREKVYYFSNVDAREAFLLTPEQFVGQNELLKPPALRIFLLGCRGSGKTTQGEWLAKQLGLFHIQFKEQLQMLLTPKIKQRVIPADESTEEHLKALKSTIEDARGDEAAEPTEEDAGLTDEEIGIIAYLTDDLPLSSHVLDQVINPYWKTEPYM